MKVLLKTTAEHKFSKKNVLPFAGEVIFNENGVTEVKLWDEGQLEQLLAAVPDLQKVEDQDHPIDLGAGTIAPEFTGSITDETIVDPVELTDSESEKTEVKEEQTSEEIAPNTLPEDLSKAGEEVDKITETPVESEALTAEVDLSAQISEKIENGQQLTPEEEAAEKKIFIAALSKKDLSGLQELCRTGGYPEAEWQSLTTKKALLTYLTDKLNTPK